MQRWGKIIIVPVLLVLLIAGTHGPNSAQPLAPWALVLLVEFVNVILVHHITMKILKDVKHVVKEKFIINGKILAWMNVL